MGLGTKLNLRPDQLFVQVGFGLSNTLLFLHVTNLKFNEGCLFRKFNNSVTEYIVIPVGTKKKCFLTLKSDLVEKYHWLLLYNRILISQKHLLKSCGSYKSYTCIPMKLKCP